jgi:hypothetical protein
MFLGSSKTIRYKPRISAALAAQPSGRRFERDRRTFCGYRLRAGEGTYAVSVSVSAAGSSNRLSMEKVAPHVDKAVSRVPPQ